MIQDFLTQSIEVLTVSFVALLAVQFVAGLMNRYRRIAPGQLEIDFNAAAIDEAIEQVGLMPYSAFIEPEPQPAVELEQVIEPAEPSDELEGMTIRQLKKLASECRIPRYCNMLKSELQQAIRQARLATT